MTLRDEILATCPTAVIASRDEAAIAALVSMDRVRPSSIEIGNGSVLEAIGIAAGNAFLDVVNNTADFRYVKPLLDQGRLKIGSPLVQATVQSMVTAGALTQANADKLLALGKEPDPVSPYQVAQAMEGM